MALYTSISTESDGACTVMTIAETPPPSVNALINFLCGDKGWEVIRETRAKSGDKYLLTVVFKVLA